jgi:hypothetical protein
MKEREEDMFLLNLLGKRLNQLGERRDPRMKEASIWLTFSKKQ